MGWAILRSLKLDPAAGKISQAVGVLGMLGLTAYAGMILQGDPKPGDTVVVSAASGGVGQIAGQLARLKGARVVGIAGRPEKCRYVIDELGYDACISHLSPTFADDLRAACPAGVDVYFENVGGAVFAGVLPLFIRAATRARPSVRPPKRAASRSATFSSGTMWRSTTTRSLPTWAPGSRRGRCATLRISGRDWRPSLPPSPRC